MNKRSNTAGPLVPWKILIADDDHDVHAATRMALRGIQFRGRPLEFVDAYSGEETLAVLRAHPDTAIIFLDVIMETEDAGLATARRIRESGFALVRIIIRTGYPGQAPERKVIVDYDIHDYKEKTGLSVQKLFTAVISALRAYDDLVALEDHRRGLMSVLESVSWFDFNAVQKYIAGMLAEFADLARLGAERIIMFSRPTVQADGVPTEVAALGDWPGKFDAAGMDDVPPAISNLVWESFSKMQALSGSEGRTLFARNHGIDLVVFASGDDAFSEADEVLLDVFLSKVCQAISNQETFTEVANDRDALLWGLALRAESWNDNAALEFERLSRLGSAIANRLQTTLTFSGEIDRQFLRNIGIAAALHDLGNDSIPVALLGKRGTFDSAERESMRSHVAAGLKTLEYFLRCASESNVLSLVRDVVSCHHERFDGTGYPNRLQGDAIPLAARVTAVADAYIAMTSERPHRPAMEPSVARTEIQAGGENGQFDPRVVQAFLELDANAGVH